MIKTVAILIGGHARRFGGLDKGRLDVGGRTVLARQAEALRGLADRVVMVGRDHAGGEAAGFEAVPDVRPGCGSLGGIHTALRAAAGPVLVLACDMPFVTRAFLAHLFDALEEWDAVVPRTAGGIHPLCAVYAQTCLPVVEERLEAGRLKVADSLELLRVRDVGPDEVGRFDPDGLLLTNLNSPDDLAGAQARLDGSGSRSTS